MTKQEYQEYQESVAAFLEDLDGPPSSGYWECPECEGQLGDEQCCRECNIDTYEYNEQHFSWSRCDCCDSSLGGDRVDYIGWTKGARKNKYHKDYRWSGQVCIDCVYYLEYGRLDDTTMLEVES